MPYCTCPLPSIFDGYCETCDMPEKDEPPDEDLDRLNER